MIRRTERTFGEWWSGEIKAIERKAKRDVITFSCAVTLITAAVILAMQIGPYWLARAF